MDASCIEYVMVESIYRRSHSTRSIGDYWLQSATYRHPYTRILYHWIGSLACSVLPFPWHTRVACLFVIKQFRLGVHSIQHTNKGWKMETKSEHHSKKKKNENWYASALKHIRIKSNKAYVSDLFFIVASIRFDK